MLLRVTSGAGLTRSDPTPYKETLGAFLPPFGDSYVRPQTH
jgi:hypothetical protein